MCAGGHAACMQLLDPPVTENEKAFCIAQNRIYVVRCQRLDRDPVLPHIQGGIQGAPIYTRSKVSRDTLRASMTFFKPFIISCTAVGVCGALSQLAVALMKQSTAD